MIELKQEPGVYCGKRLNDVTRFPEEQTSALYCDGLSLQVGVKCLCRVGGASYHCHIQAMAEDSPCLVFVEELGEMRSVPLDQLRPLPPHEARPWYTPYRKDRNRFSTIAHILKQLGNTPHPHTPPHTYSLLVKYSTLILNLYINLQDEIRYCILIFSIYRHVEFLMTNNLLLYTYQQCISPNNISQNQPEQYTLIMLYCHIDKIPILVQLSL